MLVFPGCALKEKAAGGGVRFIGKYLLSNSETDKQRDMNLFTE